MAKQGKKPNKLTPKQWFKKYWKRGVLALVVLAIVGLVVKKAVAPPKGMETMTAQKGGVIQAILASGQVKAKREAELKFNLPGKLVWLGVEEGQQVKAWQGVAALDQRLLQKDLEVALSNYMTTRYDFETTQNNTYKGQVVDEVILREFGKSQFALDRSVLAVEMQDIVRREAVLVSPIAGEVVATNSLVAGVNLSGADLEKKTVKVVDMNSLYFGAEVDEVDWAKVSKGQKVVVTVDAYPGKSCEGEVDRVGHEGVESVGGVVKVAVEVALHGCELGLIPGLNGQAQLVTQEASETLVLPKKYLVKEGGENYVWVQTGESWRQREKRQVVVGVMSAAEVAVVEGLAEGETALYLGE